MQRPSIPLFFLFVLFTAFPSLTEQVCEGVLRSRRQRESAAAEKEESARWDGLVNHASAKERILFDCYPFLKKKWKETSDRYQETEYSVGAYVFKVNLVLSVFRFGALAGVYVLAGLLYFQGKVDYAGFITTISTALFLQSQYGELFEVAGYYTEFVNLVKPFFRFMEADEEKKETGPSPDREIRLEHVAFAIRRQKKCAERYQSDGAGRRADCHCRRQRGRKIDACQNTVRSSAAHLRECLRMWKRLHESDVSGFSALCAQ